MMSQQSGAPDSAQVVRGPVTAEEVHVQLFTILGQNVLMHGKGTLSIPSTFANQQAEAA